MQLSCDHRKQSFYDPLPVAHKRSLAMFNNVIRNLRVPLIIAIIIPIVALGISGTHNVAKANEGAAFLGGMVAGHVVGGAVRRSKIRTYAALESASQPKTTETVYVQQPTSTTTTQATTTSPEQKLSQLDKLAADGYITKEEYQTRRKAVLDSM